MICPFALVYPARPSLPSPPVAGCRPASICPKRDAMRIVVRTPCRRPLDAPMILPTYASEIARRFDPTIQGAGGLDAACDRAAALYTAACTAALGGMYEQALDFLDR